MRKILIVIGVILVLAIGFLASNAIFDAPRPVFAAGDNLDTSNMGTLLNSLFPPPSFDKSNGYYRLWTLIEPAETDIEAPDTLDRYKKVHDPNFATVEYIKKWGEDFVKTYNHGHYKIIKEQRDKILEKNRAWEDPLKNPGIDWLTQTINATDKVNALERVYTLQLERYQKIIDCEFFEDFTLTEINGDMNFYAPIPNLLAWLHTAKIFLIVNMRDAAAGDWDNRVARILDHVDFSKRAVKGSRVLITNLVAKAVLKCSLLSLASIMKHPQCPATVREMVGRRLTPIQYDEYGSRKSLIAEGFATAYHVSDRYYLQKNRTMQYFYDFVSKLVNSEQSPPYLWKEGILENNGVKMGNLWWLQNPIGKRRFHQFLSPEDSQKFEYISAPSMNTVVFKSYAVKAVYDMTRIAAAFHITNTGEQPVLETLRSLQIYHDLTDPCTGEPYKLDKEQKLLYSIGTDRLDDGGKPAVSDWHGDIALALL